MGDPTPRTLESLTQAMKAIEDKVSLQFEAQGEAVRLLQAANDRQPSTREVQLEVGSLKELTSDRFHSLKELINAKAEGTKTALDAALETRKEASDKIENTFNKQFDGLSKRIDDLKERIDRSEGRGKGLGDGWIILLGVVGAASAVAGIAAVVLSLN